MTDHPQTDDRTAAVAARDRSAAGAAPFSFTSPDGHVWERDLDHQAGPRTPIMRPMFDRSFCSGLRTAFERLGAPLAEAQACHVEGWSYLRMVPAGAPDKPGSSKNPPDLVLKVVSRLHPELRRRERIARAAISGETWMDDVASSWRERPEWTSRFRTRQDVDLESVTDRAVAEQVVGAASDAEAILERHFELVTPGAGIGLAVLACADHGISGPAVAAALQGCSASTAAPRHALARIADALAATGAAPPTSIDRLRAISPAVTDLVDDYLATYGWRSLGDDVNVTTMAESPSAFLNALAASTTTDRDDETGRADPIDALVARLPVEEQARIEGMLRRAGAAYEMLDDNSGVACWGLGLARRALLEAARRLVAAGRLDHLDQIWVLSVDEAAGLLQGVTDPGPAEIERRHDDFLAAHDADPPDVIGGVPAPPPDTGLFPRGLGTIAAAVGTYLSLRFPPPAERGDTGRVEIGGHTVATGHGVGGTTATGRAVVARTAEDAMDRLRPGDVLVCPCTNPAYNAVFPMVSAVVTAVGGPLGHTAVTAREVGIPAVVGIGDLAVIADGVEITVTG